MKKIKSINYTSKFKKDAEKAKRQNKDVIILKQVITDLANGIPLPSKYKDHKLIGKYIGRRECHIQPDLLLIYCLSDVEITFERLGSHSELFK